jgi:cell division protein DivIC
MTHFEKIDTFANRTLLNFIAMKFSYKIVWNRYVIVLVIFAVWMLFFDQNSFLRQMQLKNELKSANEQKQFYLDQIRNDSIFLEELDKNIELKEKYARENYLMKKEEETVFSIVRN